MGLFDQSVEILIRAHIQLLKPREEFTQVLDRGITGGQCLVAQRVGAGGVLGGPGGTFGGALVGLGARLGPGRPARQRASRPLPGRDAATGSEG